MGNLLKEALGSGLAHLTCEGIHESRQGPVQHLEERISARVFLRATENRMLQDMGHACAVHGSGAKLHAVSRYREGWSSGSVLKGNMEWGAKCAGPRQIGGD